MSAPFSRPKRRGDNFLYPSHSPATPAAGSFHGYMNYDLVNAPPISNFRFPANQLESQSPIYRIDTYQNNFYYSQNNHWRSPFQHQIPSPVHAFVQTQAQQHGQWTPPVHYPITPSSSAQNSPHFKNQTRNNFSNQSLSHASQIKPPQFHQRVQTKQNPNCSPKTSTCVFSTPTAATPNGTKPNNSCIERVQFPPPDIELVVKDILKPFNSMRNCPNPNKRKRQKKKKNKLIVQATSPKEKKKEQTGNYYKKHMVKDPWMNLKPVVGFIVKQWVNHESMLEEVKKKCQEGSSFRVENKMSLADCLEISFEETVNGI